MNYRIVRFLDLHVGRLLCLFLSLFKLTERQAPKRPGRILLIRFWGIGSTVVSTPAVRALRQRHPKAKVTLLTMSRNRGLYDHCRLFDKIMYYDMGSIPRILWGSPRLLHELRRKRFDAAIDMEFFSRYSALLAYMCGARFTLGFSGTGRTGLYDKAEEFIENEHRTETFARLFSVLGVRTEDWRLEPLCYDDEDRLVADRLLPKQDFAIYNPNAGDFAPERMWPIERFAMLADKLFETRGLVPVIAGGPDDVPRAKALAKKMKSRAVSIAGKTTLRQLAYAMTRARLFVTNDSGPMHIGLAMGVPTVALFGPESPDRDGPKTDKAAAVYKRASCSPCIRTENQNLVNCGFGQRCMKSITVTDVLKAAAKVY